MRFTCRGDARLLERPNPEQQEAAAAAGPSSVLAALGSHAPLPLFASLTFGGGGAASRAAVKERRSGVEFPGEYCLVEGATHCPAITGAGLRTKRVAGIKSLDIYAMALYVDERGARALQHKFAEASPEALSRDPALFEELVQHENIEKTIRIVVTSGLINRRNFLATLDERLSPPLKAAGESAALEAFKRQFDAAHFRKGLEIVFVAKGGRLITRVDGQEVGSIASKPFARELLDTYIGPDPVSKPAKEAFARGLADMVLA